LGGSVHACQTLFVWVLSSPLKSSDRSIKSCALCAQVLASTSYPLQQRESMQYGQHTLQ
jgi:hypothetical protein